MLAIRNIDKDYLTAGNPETSAEVLDELSNSDSYKVRKRVAENEKICLSTLFRLLFDNEPEVRLATLANSRSPEFFVEHLVNDTNDDVRYNLAENANLKLTYLKRLEQDENPYVRERARKTLRSKFRICGDIANYQKAC